MKKFNINPLTGEGVEIKPDVFTAKFEHIATRIPLEIKLTPHEFDLLTAKSDVDEKTDQFSKVISLRIKKLPIQNT